MMVMGYFRSTRAATATSPKAKKKANKDDGRGAAAREDAGLRQSLLEQPAAAAAEGGGVPKGYFAVYAGEESRRFVVPTEYLREPAFRDLMERAADAPRRTWRTSCAASSARTPPATRGRRPSGRRVEKALSRFLFVQFALTCRDEIS